MEDWMRYWKSRTTSNLRTSGLPFFENFAWQRDYWDCRLRSNESYVEKSDYVDQNPVRAKLARTPDDWSFRGEIFELEWL